MKFRIKRIDEVGYFAQVKTDLFSGWKIIGKTPFGYGLYPDSHIFYPLAAYKEALERCKLFEQWAYHNTEKIKHHNTEEITHFYL